MVVVSEPSNIQRVLAGWAEEFSAQINEFFDCEGSAPPQLVSQSQTIAIFGCFSAIFILIRVLFFS